MHEMNWLPLQKSFEKYSYEENEIVIKVLGEKIKLSSLNIGKPQIMHIMRLSIKLGKIIWQKYSINSS